MQLLTGSFDFVLDFARRLLELTYSLAETFGKIRDLLCSEKNKDCSEDKKKLTAAEAECSKEGCHSLLSLWIRRVVGCLLEFANALT